MDLLKIYEAGVVALIGLSVAGDGGVDGAGPGVDASGEGLGVVEALLAEPHGYGEGALAVVAEDDDGLVGVELGVGAGGDVAHGHWDSADGGFGNSQGSRTSMRRGGWGWVRCWR